jgi:hypothetical protein
MDITKLEKITDYPRYDEIINKVAKFSTFNPENNKLSFLLSKDNPIIINVFNYKEYVCSSQMVKSLLNEDSTYVTIVEIDKYSNTFKPDKIYLFNKEDESLQVPEVYVEDNEFKLDDSIPLLSGTPYTYEITKNKIYYDWKLFKDGVTIDDSKYSFHYDEPSAKSAVLRNALERFSFDKLLSEDESHELFLNNFEEFAKANKNSVFNYRIKRINNLYYALLYKDGKLFREIYKKKSEGEAKKRIQNLILRLEAFNNH